MAFSILRWTLGKQKNRQRVGKSKKHTGRFPCFSPTLTSAASPNPVYGVLNRNLPVYSELVRNLEVLLKYSSKPSSASGLPLETALNSLSLSKRLGSFWLWKKCKVLRSSGEQKTTGCSKF